MITRRTALFMFAAPAIVRDTSLMPVKAIAPDGFVWHEYRVGPLLIEPASYYYPMFLRSLELARQDMIRITGIPIYDVPPRADRGSQPFGSRRLT